jgi:hypothetical protein
MLTAAFRYGCERTGQRRPVAEGQVPELPANLCISAGASEPRIVDQFSKVPHCLQKAQAQQQKSGVEQQQARVVDKLA